MKLKNRLYITMLLVSLIPLLLCGAIMLYQNTQNVESVIEENLLGVSQSQIDNIEDFFEHVKQEMQIVAQYSFLREEVLASLNQTESEEATREHLEDILIERKNYQPYILSMAIVDKNLRVVAASESYTAGADSHLSTVAPKHLTGMFSIGDVYTRETAEGKKKAVLAYQGVYQDGELIGYVIEEILTEFFEQYHEGNVFWQNGVMQVLDAKKEVVTVGGHEEGKSGFLEYQSIHDRKVEGKRKTVGYEKSGSLEYSISGVKYITCYSTLEYTDWTIRITANVDNYVQVRATYVTLFVAVLAVGALLMMVMNYYISNRTIRPIEEIREILTKVQETQDYSLRLEPGSDDEMGELQHDINRLLQFVRESQMQDKEEQKSLEKKAEKDPMTGVMNKRAIAERVQQMVEEIQSRDGKIAVGFVDIDDFRDYNTKFGHAEGDHVIKFIANTLRETIPGSVGRNGGDEFVFAMETVGKEIVEQTMELLFCKLRRGVINNVTGEQMPIPCSIGIVVDRAGKTECRNLIQEADEAMYQAKNQGKNTYYITVK